MGGHPSPSPPPPPSLLFALLQIRGAFTSLYQNLTPATWAGMFRHGGGKDMLVNDMLRATHAGTRRSGSWRWHSGSLQCGLCIRRLEAALLTQE